MHWNNFYDHCTYGFFLRIAFICYANYHDKCFNVPYTDVDYKVYTDAARYLYNGESPYNRHTYRYSPLLAFILTPNIFLHGDFGKLFFSFIDIIAAILIKVLLRGTCKQKIANICAISWLYNPMTIVISTRGNADSLVVVLVLLTLYFIDRNHINSGLIHGLSVHFRLYPVIFSLVIYLSLGDKNNNGFHYLIPNKKQIKFVIGFILSLSFFTGVSYYYYGYEFLYESFIYHLIRSDARHNFSIHFYMIYLSVGIPLNIVERILKTMPPLILLIAISYRYSNKNDLSFAIFIQAMVMVTFNSVVTSQYFFWYLSLLPLCIPYMRMSLVRCIVLAACWSAAQGLWLFDAYCLEFLGLNKFQSIWIDSLVFFVVNVKILCDFIGHYKFKCKNVK